MNIENKNMDSSKRLLVKNFSERLAWISPQTVEFCTPASKLTDRNQHEMNLDHPHAYNDRGYFLEGERRGDILRGAWDNVVLRFEDLIEYVALNEHVNGTKPWRNSRFAKRHQLPKNRDIGYLGRGYNTFNEFLDNREEEINNLINQITQHGVLPVGGKGAKQACSDDISVNLGRNGLLMFNNRGHHRLAIAKILSIKAIPVQIIVWHEKYFSNRDVNSTEDILDIFSANMCFNQISKIIN
jgi:hypothetical protein